MSEPLRGKPPTPVVGTPGGESVAVHMDEQSVTPATTAQESETALRSHGQRVVSMVWEATQKNLALSSMFSALAVAGALALFSKWLGSAELQLASVVFLFGVANLITGFYFGRTNHQRVGGPGGDSAGTR